MKKKGLITIALFVALLCSGCGNNEPVTETDSNKTKQVVDTTAEPTELTEPSESDISDETLDTSETSETGDIEQEMLPFNTLSVVKWDEMSHDFYIDVERYYADNEYYNYYRCDDDIPPEESMKKICKKNKENLTGKGEYIDNEGNAHDAAFFFKNNNAYVLYGDTHIYFQNRMIWDEIDGYDEIVKVPFPVSLPIEYYSVRECFENNESWEEKYLFPRCTFEEAKEFYRMFEDGTVVVDNKKQVIKVRGTVASRGSNDSSPIWDSGVVWDSRPVWAIFDFKNQTYEVQNEDGTFYHSCETLYNKIESEYKSAGIIDDKEVIYDIGCNVIVKENGKRRIIMNEEEMNEFLEDIPGYNCVGEDCILKLTKIKGNKYYFDVTATLYDESKWTHNDTLVIKEKK